MNDVLGLLGMVVFAAAVIALAGAVTWLVVKFLPAKDTKATPGIEADDVV